jgi:CHAD domain-containing protein
MKHEVSAAEVVTAALGGSVAQLTERTAAIVDDPALEHVHQARVATRRLRSDLRTFRPLLTVEVAAVRSELAWVAAALGAVRDVDVMTERITALAADLPPEDHGAAAPMLRQLERERAAGMRKLMRALGSARFAKLSGRLAAITDAPPLTTEAQESARKVLEPLAHRPWRKVRSAIAEIDAGDTEPSDEVLHELRIRAKRARYAAEAVGGAAGPKVRRRAKQLAELQGVLGDLHDVAVATSWLRDRASEASAATALAIGQMIAAERREADDLRARWRTVLT